MTVLSNIHLTHGLMLACALASVVVALPEGSGRIVAGVLLAAMATAEVVLAIRGPADQPTMELGMTVIASFLLARAAAVMVRAYHETRSDLHDRPAPPVEE